MAFKRRPTPKNQRIYTIDQSRSLLSIYIDWFNPLNTELNPICQ